MFFVKMVSKMKEVILSLRTYESSEDSQLSFSLSKV